VWGAASSAYQVEGAAAEDGRGRSVWDVFCDRHDTIADGSSGGVACDHYHRWQNDIGLMKEIGLAAYRFSVSWPRVLPNGVGTVNKPGLAFYDALVDRLLEAGIIPYITLFHWDFPHKLYKRGGWLNPASPNWFADYTRVVVEMLSDRVQHWMTLNEPQVFIEFGHHTGNHAPGLRYGLGELLVVGHHTLLAHGKAVQSIRAHARQPVQVGFAPVGVTNVPASDAPEDIAAARKATFSITEPNVWNNTWFSDPIFLGEYPRDGLQLFGRAIPAHIPQEKCGD